jgi:pimeloyl-ACP methyl ester carboxylesterase
MSEAVKPFQVDVSSEEVARLDRKLKTTRVPSRPIVSDARKDYGFTHEWATELYTYWTDRFSWSEAADRINTWPHFTTQVEEQSIHFVHAQSAKADALPLLLIHGWPGSFYEFSEVIDPFRNDDGNQTFHCVVPSLPGFCWSSGPPRGWAVKDTARVFNTLMHRLGYTRYVVQAGDWGHFVARELGAQHADSCLAVHFNYTPGVLPKDVELTEQEAKVQARRQDWMDNHLGYAVMMRSRPMTIGWMLQDNPIAIMAWVGEKYNELADPELQDSDRWRDHILTTVCLYYFSNCSMTASLVYYENTKHEDFPDYILRPENRVVAPMGYSSFYFDSAPSSERAVERTGNLVFYRERDRGGHFACLESPDEVVDDVRQLVKVAQKLGGT